MAIDNLVEVTTNLQRANAELTARAEKAENALANLRALASNFDICNGCWGNCPDCPLNDEDGQ